MRFLLIALVAVTGVAFFLFHDNGAEPAVATATIQPDPEIAVAGLLPPCEIGFPVPPNEVMAVNEKFEVRATPGLDAKRLINERASSLTVGTHYQLVDNSTTVRRYCEEGEWPLVSIVDPAWLNDVRGWVPTSNIRRIERTTNGRRLYTEADFLWDNDSLPYSEKIVAAVNKISEENSRCGSIDASSMALSASKSSPADPVFFVTCGSGSGAFNVWFRPSDIENGESMAAIAALGRDQAVLACKDAAAAAANNPSTVDFSTLNAAYDAAPSGRSTLQSTFAAKNAFNLETKFNIRCLFDGITLVESSIWQ
ncbi:hypothetical protein [Paradevosia shaoguanensis]|uniref:hypothetical protein n=1 Tax=Paradevosia shaoguanensis TaxID=1335043 RepID=UPI003C762781